MGQGTHTTLAMLLAEELEVEMDQIRHIETLHHPDFKHPTFSEWTKSALNAQMTGGSVSIRAWNQPFRKLGATARELLRSAAARQWRVPVSECKAANGHVKHSSRAQSGLWSTHWSCLPAESSRKSRAEISEAVPAFGKVHTSLGHFWEGKWHRPLWY